MPADTDRPRGLMTEKDRLYLRDGELPDSKQARYERKRGVRDRIKNGVLDFYDVRQLPIDQLRKLFDGMEPGDDLYEGLSSMIRFTFRAVQAAGLDYERFLEESLRPMYEWGPPGRDGEDQHFWLDSFEVSINDEYETAPDTLALLERFKDGDDLTPEEIGYLVESGTVDMNDEWDRLRERYSED